MKPISATKYEKSVALTYPQVLQILARNGLYDVKKHWPTRRAFKQKCAMLRSVEDPNDQQSISFITWAPRKIDIYFDKPSQLELIKFNLKKSNVQRYLCEAFSNFGTILEIEYSVHCLDLTTEANKTVIAAYFGELRSAQGLRLLHRLFTKDEMEPV